MSNPLSGKSVAILLDNGFEQVEMTEPRRELEAAGAQTALVSPVEGRVQGWHHHDRADTFSVDVPLATADPNGFEALLVPGGVINADQMRLVPGAVQFVRSFFDSQKPVAVICHGPWMLVEADVVRGRALTSWPSLQTDIRNAGGIWVNEPVVTDGGLGTSRKPDDIPQFNPQVIAIFAAGKRAEQREMALAP